MAQYINQLKVKRLCLKSQVGESGTLPSRLSTYTPLFLFPLQQSPQSIHEVWSFKCQGWKTRRIYCCVCTIQWFPQTQWAIRNICSFFLYILHPFLKVKVLLACQNTIIQKASFPLKLVISSTLEQSVQYSATLGCFLSSGYTAIIVAS